MQTTTLIFIIIALLLSISIAYFQYFYKVKGSSKINFLLFSLRSLSLFLLGLLLLNPIIEHKEVENIKPILSVLVDNSQSVKYFQHENTVNEIIEKVNNQSKINEKFDIKFFSFGSSINLLDSLNFNENHTNIYEAISNVNELFKNDNGAILMISDGNQTIGNDYEFVNSKEIIYPIVIGDTTQYKDLKINQLNANKYSYIKNKFPVETFLYYEGNEAVESQFSIFNNGKTIFTKKINFSSDNKSQTVTANIQAIKEGQNYFTASLKELPGEKNINNNSKNFSVEVINEQTKVLILSSVLHPDLGAFKKSIERNKQRTADIKMITDFNNQINDYQLVILYQPTRQFDEIISLLKQDFNYFIVSGANTDWNFMNQQQLGFTKKAINQTENYVAKYNPNFLTFLQKNIGFNQFSPLIDLYGEVYVTKPHQIILFQEINGIETQQPVLVTLEEGNQKSAILFGEGIWKWRASSFLNENSFQEFDDFIGNLVQYLASTKKRNRLEVKSESLFAANATIKMSAFYTDKNFKFDNRASLELTITNLDTKEIKKQPFSLVNNSYQIEVENLKGNNYDYEVSVVGQNIIKKGRFKITDYKIEEQFTSSNYRKLEKVANRTGGKLYFPNQIEITLNDLEHNELFYTTQKSSIKEQYLIDWEWLLFFILSLLSVEWFIRKYFGKL